MKTTELTGLALDWAVAQLDGWTLTHDGIQPLLERRCSMIGLSGYVTLEADDIIDREGISVIRCDDDYGVDERGFCNNVRIPVWAACLGHQSRGEVHGPQGDNWGTTYSLDVDDVAYGATRREAAMRAWVREKRGAEVEVPAELLP